MTEKLFITYWTIWNLSWAFPYSFTWMYFYKTGNKMAACTISMMMIFAGAQIVIPLIGFEYFFDTGNYSINAIVGTFALICMPNALSNFLVPKLSSTKFGMVFAFTPICMLVLLTGQYLQLNYLNNTTFSLGSAFSLFVYPIVLISYALFIRFFLLKGSVKDWKQSMQNQRIHSIADSARSE